MNNIKDITIRNYRGIRYAEVNGMARVNVFLGNNNCGKSSVLESVLMLLGANSPALPLAVNVNRNYSTVDKNDFALFFHNCDVANVINIEACLADNTSMRLDMTYSESAIDEIPVSDMQNGMIETLKDTLSIRNIHMAQKNIVQHWCIMLKILNCLLFLLKKMRSVLLHSTWHHVITSMTTLAISIKL